MKGALPGKLLAIAINGQKIRCQTDATLTLTANLTEDDPCKPDDVSTSEDASWVTRTVDSRDWSLSGSAKSFLDDLRLNGFDLAEKFIGGDLDVEIEFLTTPGQHSFPEDVVYAGAGLLATLTLNAPVSGSSTHDFDISGNGPLTLTRIPVTT